MRRPGPSDRTDGAAERFAIESIERRPRTEAELRRALAGRGFADAVVAAVVDRLRRAGFVDDRALAVQYLVSRADRLGHAPARLAGELRARGVSDATIAEAEREAREVHGIDARAVLRRQVERRTAGAGADPARTRRAYRGLVRAGHDDGEVRAALGIDDTRSGDADEAPARRRGRHAAEDGIEP